ncbi:MAG: amidohydrolase [Actinomycetota bacterium]|nr:amidohydrolase [Actinomycetota bacterium]
MLDEDSAAATSAATAAGGGDPRIADLAIVNCTALLSATSGRTRFAPGATLEITNGRFTRIDPNPVRPPQAREIIDAHSMVAMPGLINTHCHAAMTFLRGAAEDVHVGQWFNDYIWPMEVNVGPRDVYLGTLVAAAEMIECGVTTFADHYFFMNNAAQAVIDSGMRANLGSAFFSSQGPEGLAQSVEFAEKWNGKADGRITTCIAPHAPYTVNDDDLRGAAEAAARLGVRVHTHGAEDIAQTNNSLAARGATPMEVLRDTGCLEAGAIIAHGNGIIETDIPLLAAHRDRVGVTHGPKGYLKFALGPLTPIPSLRAAGVPVGYCTDGVASNNNLDIFESMRITAIMQKQLANDATWFTSAMALEMAGPESAAVLGMRGRIGELTVGACADVILVDTSGFHCQPVHDLAAALVYSIQPCDVRTTIVDGRVLMRDRQLLTIDRDSLLAEFRMRAREITDRTHGRTIQDYAP